MSAKGRGLSGDKYDFYSTPIETTVSFLNNYSIGEGIILEPSAGSGNIVKALRSYGIKNDIIAVEKRDERDSLIKSGATYVEISDFFEYQCIVSPSYIIGNPPYNIAEEFIDKCFEISDGSTEIIMLLRTAFLESQKRRSFWEKHKLTELHVLAKRPSFGGLRIEDANLFGEGESIQRSSGTDAASYSWFVWNNKSSQTINIIY